MATSDRLDLVGPARQARWDSLAAAHPDVVTAGPGTLRVEPFLVDLVGGLVVRHRALLPEGTVAFGWSDAIAPEAHVVVGGAGPGAVLVVSDSDRLVLLGHDLDAVLDEVTDAATSVLAERDALVCELAGVESIDELEPDEVEELLVEALEGAMLDRCRALAAGADASEVPAPTRADLLDLDGDPVLAGAVDAAGRAWGLDLAPDPARTYVVDLRDAAPGAVADLRDVVSSPAPVWGGLDPTGRILTWRTTD